MDVTLERIFFLMDHSGDGKIARGGKAKFARSIGYDSGDIVSMWENGSSKSYLKKLHEIAAKYDVSVEWLKGETDDMGGTGRYKGSDQPALIGTAGVAAGITGAAMLPGAPVALAIGAAETLFNKKKKPVSKDGDELMRAGYGNLTPENRALIDQMIEKLLKSQSDE